MNFNICGIAKLNVKFKLIQFAKFCKNWNFYLKVSENSFDNCLLNFENCLYLCHLLLAIQWILKPWMVICKCFKFSTLTTCCINMSLLFVDLGNCMLVLNHSIYPITILLPSNCVYVYVCVCIQVKVIEKINSNNQIYNFYNVIIISLFLLYDIKFLLWCTNLSIFALFLPWSFITVIIIIICILCRTFITVKKVSNLQYYIRSIEFWASISHADLSKQ